MAVPKRKQSKQRTNTRYANYKAATPPVGECSKCHEPKAHHRVCKACGYYDGVLRLDIAKDSK